MKACSFAIVFLCFLQIGCRNGDDAIPNDLLYRKWRITKIQYSTGDPVEVTATTPWALVTFTSKGTILYGEDGKYDPCCSPARFKRKGATLDLQDVADIPMPERRSNSLCAAVDCAPYGASWQIVTLNLNELVIQQDRAVVTYVAYP